MVPLSGEEQAREKKPNKRALICNGLRKIRKTWNRLKGDYSHGRNGVDSFLVNS